MASGEAEVSKLLLEANANPNVTDRYAQTPIFFAPTRPDKGFTGQLTACKKQIQDCDMSNVIMAI